MTSEPRRKGARFFVSWARDTASATDSVIQRPASWEKYRQLSEELGQRLARSGPTEESEELDLGSAHFMSPELKRGGLGEVSGGVSLGDVIQRKGGRSFQTDPRQVRRAGLFDETSSFDVATGSRRIPHVLSDGRVVVGNERRLSTTADGRAIVDVVVTGRRAGPFGSLKAWSAQTGQPEQQRVEDLRAAARFLLAGAGRLIPQSERDRYLEEFHAELLDLPRRGRLRHALSMLRGVLVLRLRHGFKNTAGAARKA